MSRPSPVPDWMLERYALAELSPEQMDALRVRIEAEPELRARLGEIAASDAETLARYPSRAVAAEVARRLVRTAERPAERPVRRPWLWPSLAVAPAALVAGLAIFLNVTDHRGGFGVVDLSHLEETRFKGGVARLIVKVQRGDRIERLADGATVASGELLQLSYLITDRVNAVVFSLDGWGAVTLHWPLEPGLARPLDSGVGFMPSAYELDDAPGFERFFLVFAAPDFMTTHVTALAAELARTTDGGRTGALPLEKGFVQRSVLLLKEPIGDAGVDGQSPTPQP